MVHSELDDLDLDPFEFRVYAHMVRRAARKDGKGTYYEGAPKSAKHCRMDLKTYRRAVRGLVERRLITREDRPGQPSVYRLTPPRLWLPLPETVGVPNPVGVPETAGEGRPDTAGVPLPETVDKGSPKKGTLRREPKEIVTRKKFDPLEVDLPPFVSPDAWADFVQHRRDLGKRLTPRAVELILADLKKTPADADEMLRTSVKRGWTGVFPLDGNRKTARAASPILDQYTERGL